MKGPLLPTPNSSSSPPTRRYESTEDDLGDDESFGSDFDALAEADDPLGADPVPVDDPVPSDDESFGSDFDALAEADDIPYVPGNPPVYSPFAAIQPPQSQLSSLRNVSRKPRQQEDAGLRLAPSYPRQGGRMCGVCQQRPAYSKGGKSYPTCGLKCAGILETARNSYTQPSHSGGSPRAGPPAFRTGSYQGGSIPSTNQPIYSSENSPTSPDPSIAYLSQHLGGYTPRRPRDLSNHYNFPSSGGSRNHNAVNEASYQPPPAPMVKCVVCLVKPCRKSEYITCGLICAEKLCNGGANPNNCDYCHRRPKIPGYGQCGQTCAEKAKLACLLCKSRPKFKRYHLCGKTCKQIADKSTPLILEAPPGHATYKMVENKFKSAWKAGTPPSIKMIYKIIESKNFLQPYDRYKKSIGNEVFRYHGTKRSCTLGLPGNRKLCSNSSCSLCNILRTSFKTSLANPGGGFGPGVYSSSASSKAYGYSGGVMLLTKVVLGNVRQVTAWGEVRSCPPGFNSVAFDVHGPGNETIVYTDDAIRPVFLIVF